MAATVHVVARFHARAGREEELQGVLSALVRPTRRELGCYQYDLLVNASDPRDFCFVERWDDDLALDQHLASDHVKTALERSADLIETPPDVRRYRIV